MDRDYFLETLFGFQQESPNVVKSALAEVGAKTAESVSASDRRIVLNICERRLPRTRKRHLVQGESFIGEAEFWGYRRKDEFDDPAYKVEKGGYEIER
jgi:hypothetical protein